MYEPRTYRRLVAAEGLTTFEVRVAETDLQIAAERDLTAAAHAAVRDVRATIEAFIAEHPDFAATLEPYPHLSEAWPAPVRAMVRAGRAAGTGPMAAVAGAVAEAVGRALLPQTRQVIVENGGDVFLATDQERVLALYAGQAPLSLRVGLRIGPELSPVAVCTSSGTVGPSLSLGKADAATVLGPDAALADAAATALGNRVARAEHVEAALDWVLSVEGVLGAVVLVGETLGARGRAVELVRL